MKKTIILISIVVVVSIVSIFYFGGKKSTENKNNTGTTASSTELYSDDAYKFSFKYPKSMKVISFPVPEWNGMVITATYNESSTGFQVLITPFDEPLTILTVERIKQDTPDLTIVEPQEVLLGSVGKGVAFKDGITADSNRHVWFIARGNLYQITAKMSFDEGLQKVLNTWIFL